MSFKQLIKDLGGKRETLKRLVDGDVYEVDGESYKAVRFEVRNHENRDCPVFIRTDTDEVIWSA